MDGIKSAYTELSNPFSELSNPQQQPPTSVNEKVDKILVNTDKLVANLDNQLQSARVENELVVAVKTLFYEYKNRQTGGRVGAPKKNPLSDVMDCFCEHSQIIIKKAMQEVNDEPKAKSAATLREEKKQEQQRLQAFENARLEQEKENAYAEFLESNPNLEDNENTRMLAMQILGYGNSTPKRLRTQ